MMKRIHVMAAALALSTNCVATFLQQPAHRRRLAFLYSDRSHNWRWSTTDTSSTLCLQASSSSSSSNGHLISLVQSLKLFQSSSLSSGSNNVKFIDATWYHKGNRSGRQEFEQGPRIPNSCYFDMMDIANNDDNNNNNLRIMLPSQRLFATAMDAMNIQQSNDVIIYGRQGSYFAPRVWFTFAVAMQHPSRVWLMQGSLQDWQAAGGPVEIQPKKVFYVKDLLLNHSDAGTTSSFKYHDVLVPQSLDNDDSNDVGDDDRSLSWLQSGRFVATLEDIKQVVLSNTTRDDKNKRPIIIDARGSSFAKGHMPNAIHIPYSSLVLANNTCRFKPREEMQDIFRKAIGDETLFRDNPVDDEGKKPTSSTLSSTTTPIICSCGSGVSACTLYLALLECGRNVTIAPTAMYDGSWQEYKLYKDLPKVVDVVVDENRL